MSRSLLVAAALGAMLSSLPAAVRVRDLPAVQLPAIPERSVRLTDFGAVADGRTPATAAFAAAIERVAAQGGGRVIVPAGEWRTGPIVLRSRVALHLEKGALIRFSENRDDYPLVETDFEGGRSWRCQSPISGNGLEDIAITGEGTIDGSGQVWRPVKKSKQTPEQWAALVASGGVLNPRGDIWYPSAGSLEGNESPSARGTRDPQKLAAIRDALRPVMVSLRDCRRVLLEGVTFQNSPAWNIHPLYCEHLAVRRVTVTNPWYAQNGDGLDLDSCRDVLVEDSTFDVGDDAICLKSGRDEAGRRRQRPTERITVRRCRVLHGHGGFVIGSEMSSGVRDVRVSDCELTGTDVGLRFKSTRGRGGVVENILVERVRMAAIPRDAITFDLFYGGKAPTEVDASDAAAAEAAPVPPADITTPAFRNITLRDVTCEGAGRAALLQGLPEMPLENIRLEDCAFRADAGILMSDVVGLTLERVRLDVASGVPLELRRSRDVVVRELAAPTTTAGPVVHVSGANSSGIVLPANLPDTAVTRAPGVPAAALRRE
ncbi:MAG: glycoside hydrolase family 28 protein [Opitutaceae bacterium]|nr:glycoside hydrolase family 28 protein [Opitutaceae bacterium]